MNTNLNIHSATFAVPFNLTDDINRDPSSLSGSDTYTKKICSICSALRKVAIVRA